MLEDKEGSAMVAMVANMATEAAVLEEAGLLLEVDLLQFFLGGGASEIRLRFYHSLWKDASPISSRS